MQKNQSVLAEMGLVIAITGTMCYTPAPKPAPSADVVAKYVTTHTTKYKYNPYLNRSDAARSDARKQELLNDIRSIRQQIREMATLYRAEKLIATAAANLMNTARNKEREILMNRAREIKVPIALLNRDKVLARKGRVSIELI